MRSHGNYCYYIYLSCQQMYDFEGVFYNSDRHKFLSIVSSVHHQGINQSVKKCIRTYNMVIAYLPTASASITTHNQICAHTFQRLGIEPYGTAWQHIVRCCGEDI